MANQGKKTGKLDLNALGLKPVPLGGTVLLSSNSRRQQQAKQNILKRKGLKQLTNAQITRFLETQLAKLYNRVRISGALTQEKVSEYLKAYTHAAFPVLGEIPRNQQRKVIKRFQVSTQNIIDYIGNDHQLAPKEVLESKVKIINKAERLYDKTSQKRADIVADIGVDIAAVEEKGRNKKEIRWRQAAFQEEIIPIGINNDYPKISILDFLQLPLGTRGKTEKNWFDEHLQYLTVMISENLLTKAQSEKIRSLLEHVPKVRYRKYFSIFQAEKFQDATFMALYSLYQNQALDHLRSN